MDERAESAATRVSTPVGRTSIAIAGGGPRATSVLLLLKDLPNLVVAGVCDPDPASPAIRLAHELGVFATTDPKDLLALEDLDLVLDLSDDPAVREALGAGPLDGIVTLSGSAADLVWDLLITKKRGEERERILAELQVAYDQIRSQERRLSASKDALERANEELERRLAEIFFIHEFFKALTMFISVSDVTSLIVDGANGILGAEISAVYLIDQQDWTLRLRASQGRSEDMFRPVVPVSETILGAAFRDGYIQQSDVPAGSTLCAWARRPDEVRSQAAIPLRSGDAVIGVLVIASGTPRELTDAERDRLHVIANQASLALQNALLHEELERLSVTDRLTELYNHGYLHQRLDEELERSVRFGHRLAVIMLDIDGFKQFNDRYGHPKGDEVLKTVSSIITQNLREIDVAARYGGEEFVIVLPETDAAGALAVAERVRVSMERHPHITDGGDEAVSLTVSLGVAAYPTHASSVSGLIEAADQAMYDAKRAGKNQVALAR
jgi:diguanylate cyclase (GGDEF)-like protein